MEVLEQSIATRSVVAEPDVRAARRSLREQIAKLESDLGAAICAAYPRVSPGPSSRRLAGPRLLDLGDLEALRDELAFRLRNVQRDEVIAAQRHAAKRLLIESMLREPGRHRWVRVSNADLGEPGCKHWHVRPRLGLIGVLAGWWHVKISSGCPLAGGSRPSRPRSTERPSWASEVAGSATRVARLEP